jgi:hypothetical protein
MMTAREPEGKPAVARAYKALRIAAERIGANNYRAGLYNPRQRGGYSITDAHKDAIEAMRDVLSGAMSPNDAMALLHRGDVLQERLRYDAQGGAQ